MKINLQLCFSHTQIKTVINMFEKDIKTLFDFDRTLIGVCSQQL